MAIYSWNYGKWPFVDDLPIKNGDLCGYVGLPKGNRGMIWVQNGKQIIKNMILFCWSIPVGQWLQVAILNSDLDTHRFDISGG